MREKTVEVGGRWERDDTVIGNGIVMFVGQSKAEFRISKPAVNRESSLELT